MSAINYYSSQSDYDSGLVSERDEYTFDAYGRRHGFVRYTANNGTGFLPVISNGTIANDPNFNDTRIEATLYDARGRIVQEVSPEGTLSYDYDALGRMTYTAINADPPVVDLAKDPLIQKGS